MLYKIGGKCKPYLEYYKDVLKQLGIGTDELTNDEFNEDEQEDEFELEKKLPNKLKMDKKKDNLLLALQRK